MPVTFLAILIEAADFQFKDQYLGVAKSFLLLS